MTSSPRYQNTILLAYAVIIVDLFLFVSVLIGFSRQQDVPPEVFRYYIKFGYYLIGTFFLSGFSITYLKQLQKKEADSPTLKPIEQPPSSNLKIKTSPVPATPIMNSKVCSPAGQEMCDKFNKAIILPVGLLGLAYLYLLIFLHKTTIDKIYYLVPFVVLIGLHISEFAIEHPMSLEAKRGPNSEFLVSNPYEARKSALLVFAIAFICLGIGQMFLISSVVSENIFLLYLTWAISTIIITIIVLCLLISQIVYRKI